MSSSDRRTVLSLLAALPLAGCGFAPVHGPPGAGAALRGRILPDAPEDRPGFVFAARIEDRLGPATAPGWALGYRIETDRVAVGITPENVTTRYHLTGRVLWSLRPAGGGDPVLSGEAASFTAYSATGTTVATLTARRDAEERLMTILADQIVARLQAEAGRLGG